MITMKTNFGGAFKFLQKLEKQTRFATAVALTRTAQAVAKREAEEVAKVFDKPTNFTRKAFVVKRATPANLQAKVTIRERQADYLNPHIEGGGRWPKRMEMMFAADARAPGNYWMPGKGIALNAHGNISKSQIVKLAAQLRKSGKHGEVFAGVPRPGLPFGIYGRKMQGGRQALTPLLVLVKRAPRYKKIFRFYEIGYGLVGKEFPVQFRKALSEAMRSAR